MYTEQKNSQMYTANKYDFINIFLIYTVEYV